MKRIYHERDVRVLYSLLSNQQSVIYWATNHLLRSLYFDSNTQETTKRQVYPSDVFFSFLPLHEKNSRQEL